MLNSFRDRFEVTGNSHLVKLKLRNRCKQPEESYKQLANDIRHLTRHAYPDVSDRNTLEAEAFVSAVTDPSVLTRLVEQNPQNLADAQTMAVRTSTINDSVQAMTSKFSSVDFLSKQTRSRDQTRTCENPPRVQGDKKQTRRSKQNAPKRSQQSKSHTESNVQAPVPNLLFPSPPFPPAVNSATNLPICPPLN